MNLKVKMLTMDDVKQLLTMKDAIELVESAFREKGLKRVQMPPKQYLYFKKHKGDLRIMPSYLAELDEVGVKLVNVHPDNPAKYNLPTVMAIILLFDPKTGAPISIMNGTFITSMRTGAAAGVATKYLARKNSRVVAMVGAGAQARTQLLAMNEVLDINEVRVYDTIPEKAGKYAAEMGKKLEIDVKPAGDLENTVRNSDVLVSITPVRSPIIKSDWISQGMHINAIGADAPGKEELDPEILKRAKIVVDDWGQASHSGEINMPLKNGIITKNDIYADIGEIVAGVKPARVSDDEITVFDSTGLSVQDVITAWHVYKTAEEKGLGREIPAFYL